MFKTKVGAFVTSIVTTILSSIGLYLFNQIVETSKMQGLERLSLIVLIPFYILLGCVMIALIFSATFSSIKAIGSDVKAIKIIAIIILVVDIAIIGCTAYLTGIFINNLK